MRRAVTISIAIFVAIAVWAPAQAAQGSGSGQITYFVSTTANGLEGFVVRFSTMTPGANCNTADRFFMSAASPQYKTTVAMVLGAFLAGTPMYVVGTGACTISSSSEDLAYACYGTDPC